MVVFENKKHYVDLNPNIKIANLTKFFNCKSTYVYSVCSKKHYKLSAKFRDTLICNGDVLIL